jgi:hypothetical protein
LSQGDSISVNGTCLTATELTDENILRLLNTRAGIEILTELLAIDPFSLSPSGRVDFLAALEKQSGKPVQLLDGEMLSWYGSRAIAGLRYLHNLQAE